MRVNVNGQILPIEKASIPITDHGLLYGCGLFEILRAYEGHLFLIDDHLKRLAQGMEALGIRFGGPLSYFEAEIQATLEANRIRNGVVRFTLTAGNEGWGLPRAPYDQPNYFILVREIDEGEEGVQPKTMTVLRTRRNTPPEGPVRYKTLNYLNSLKGMQELWTRPADEGLFVTEKGEVAEGIASNLFMVRNGRIYTPPVATGILPGITRRFVIELARKLGYAVEERTFSLGVLSGADEVFLTNAAQGIVPVARIDHLFVSKSDRVVTELRKAYQACTHILRSVSELKKRGNPLEPL